MRLKFSSRKVFAIALPIWLLAGAGTGVLEAQSQQAAPVQARAAEPDQPEGEPFIRALLIDAVGSSFRDTIRLDRLIADIRSSPFTHIIIQVRSHGDAFYDSSLVPRALGVSDQFDPLGHLIESLREDPGTHARQVIAWLDLYRISNVNRMLLRPDDHVSRLHPDWLMRDWSGATEDRRGNQYLEPGLAEVQAHIEAVVKELVENYELSGVVFDGLRYPGLEAGWGYHPEVVRSWQAESGSNELPSPGDLSWRRHRIAILERALRQTAQAAKQARPGIVTAAFAMADGPAPLEAVDFQSTSIYLGALQDWPGWMKSGAVDRLIVRNFHNDSQARMDFDAWNRFAAAMVQTTNVEILTGVAGFTNTSKDAFAQVMRTQQSGLMGAVLSNYREPVLDLNARNLFFLALERTIQDTEFVRQAFPVREVASVTTPTESAPEATQEDPGGEQVFEIPPPPEMVPEVDESAQSTTSVSAGTETPTADGELGKLLDEAQGRFQPKSGTLVEPSDEALQLLRRRFPNIFP